MIIPVATKEERLAIIKECKSSGIPGREWCRQHGINWNTYHTWVTRAKKKGLVETAATIPTVMQHEPEKPEIVRVAFSNEESFLPSKDLPENIYQEEMKSKPEDMLTAMEIEVSGIRIKVSNQVDPELLAEVIRQIGGIRRC